MFMQRDDKEVEDQFELITSDTYFTSINVEATLKILHELALEYASRGQLDDENKAEFEAIESNISELSRQRNELHDLLEIETINANKKRRTLQVLPKSFNQQLEDVVTAARQLNSDKILSLQKKLKALKEEVSFMEKRMLELNSENVKLKPECDIIRKDHDQIIAQLNHRMSVKSSKQIILNETSDDLRDVQQQTADIDIGLQNLADDLEQDKKEAAAMKNELLNEKKETENDISEVNKLIDVEKKLLNLLMEQSTQKSIEIQERNKIISRLENSVTRLKLDGIKMNDKIEREIRENENVEAKIKKFTEIKDKEEKLYKDKISLVEKKLKQVCGEKDVVEQEYSETSRMKDESFEVKQDAIYRKNDLLRKGKEEARDVVKLKQELNERIEEIGTITLRNNDIQEQMQELEENHRATVELYQTQTEELTEHLNKEQGERVKVQIQRETSEKHLETFRVEETKFINNISSKINKAANEHQQLTEETLNLSRETKKKKQQINTLKVKLEVAHGSFRSMKSSLAQDIDRLKRSVEALKNDVAKKRRFQEEKVPFLADLKTECERMNGEYTESKNQMLVIRNQEKSVNEQKNRTTIMVDKIRKAASEVKVKVEKTREKCLEQLKKEKNERGSLEGEINEIIFRLETIYKSNQKFQDAYDDIEWDFDLLMMAMKGHASKQQRLVMQFMEIQKVFNSSWLTTIGMEKESADHDAKLLIDIQRIQKDAEERSITLTEIVKIMEHDLQQLTNFTDNVSRRRPKDTRQSRRRARILSQAKSTPTKSPAPVRLFRSIPGIERNPPDSGFERKKTITSARSHTQQSTLLQPDIAFDLPASSDKLLPPVEAL